MIKEGVLILIILISLNLASAAYVCSDNSSVITDQGEVDLGKARSITGLRLGLIKANEVVAINLIEAELFIDAQKVTLTDELPSEVIEFKDENEYNVSLVNSSESSAKINVDGSSEEIEEGEKDKIKGLEVFLYKAEGTYPGDASVEVLLGKDDISLSNTANPSEIITLEGVEYAVEIVSASDTNAVIRVVRCEDENAEIQEIEDPDDETEDQDLPDNQTDNETANQTLNGNITENQTEINVSDEINNESGNQSKDIEDGTDDDFFNILGSIAFYGLIAFVVVCLILLFRYMKNKADERRVEEINKPDISED